MDVVLMCHNGSYMHRLLDSPLTKPSGATRHLGPGSQGSLYLQLCCRFLTSFGPKLWAGSRRFFR
jgi:hypothetical protein